MNKTRIVYFNFVKCCEDITKDKFSIIEYIDASFILDVTLNANYNARNNWHLSTKDFNVYEIAEDKLTKFILEYSKYIIKIENE